MDEPAIRIGISGWTYAPWRGTFYPAGLPHRRELDERMTDRALTTTDAERPLHHVVEVRNPSFAVPAFTGLMREHGIGTVVADSAGCFPQLTDVTSDLVYVRLHGADELYVSGYTDTALDAWAAKVLAWHDAGLVVHVYFDNDVKVRSPFDAMNLANRVGTRLPPTTPSREAQRTRLRASSRWPAPG